MKIEGLRSGPDTDGNPIVVHIAEDIWSKEEEMGKYQRDMSELGPLGIVRETVTIYYDNAATLVWIQLTMVLPAMIAIMASGQLLDLATQVLGLDSDSASPTPAGSSLVKLFELIAVYIVLLLINLAIAIASIAALFYTVGCSYTGKIVTYGEIVHSLPKLWARLVVTGLCGYLIACVVILINAVINLGIFAFLSSQPFNMISLLVLMTLLVLIFCFYFGTILQVANGVTTLEENYGIAALSKAEKLLRGKWWTALGLFLIYAVPVGALAYANECAKKYLNWGENETIKKLLMQALFVAVNSLMLQWSILNGGVLYVACKAFHHESIVLYISLDPNNLNRFPDSPRYLGSYVEKDDPGNVEPRPSFGRSAFSGDQLKDRLEAMLSNAGAYWPIHSSRHSSSSGGWDDLEVSLDVDIPPELTSSRNWRGRGKSPVRP